MRLLIPATLAALSLPAQAQFWSEIANPKVEVTLVHPPGLGLKVERLAFAPSRDLNSRELADALTADLVQSRQVEVVDRAHLDAVLKEQELGASGYVEPATIAKLGKLLGPSVLVIVNVNRSDLSRTQSAKEERSTDYKTKKELVRLKRTATTSLDFSATVQVVDLSTGRVFGAQRLEDAPSLSNTSYEGYPAYPRDSDVRRLAFEAAKVKVLRLLLAWSEVRKLTFFDDDVFGMGRAHERLKARDVRGALDLALEGLDQSRQDKGQKPKYYPRAEYNVGIIRFILGQYDDALPHLRAALDMQPDASIFQTALKECQEAIALQEALRRSERQAETRSEEAAGPDRPSPRNEPQPGSQPGPEGLAKASPEARLQKLQDLYRKGLLDKKDYEAKKAEILKEL
ncbi:CsgG/HfaB family protein [Geothrix alkalitolerans]|uniref:CsgG/HfaB family protein n=1 Tax=Geothrix alkalitolerans TaxID=2922724 RepID=UPI001FAF1D17|nr:CsgG/HfaB family protein [Geothrix alkalitolerans]